MRSPAAATAEPELVQRYRESGDGRWFEELYRQSRPKVLGVCMKLLRDTDRAEDACHDAFLRAYDRFSSLQGTRFSAWVCRIAANRCYDELRQKARREEVPVDENPDLASPSAIEGEAISRQELQRALAIVRSLEEHQRKVFLLRHVDRKSYREIEVETGYEPGEVKSFLQNARRNFQLTWERGSVSAPGGSHG